MKRYRMAYKMFDKHEMANALEFYGSCHNEANYYMRKHGKTPELTPCNYGFVVWYWYK